MRMYGREEARRLHHIGKQAVETVAELIARARHRLGGLQDVGLRDGRPQPAGLRRAAHRHRMARRRTRRYVLPHPRSSGGRGRDRLVDLCRRRIERRRRLLASARLCARAGARCNGARSRDLREQPGHAHTARRRRHPGRDIARLRAGPAIDPRDQCLFGARGRHMEFAASRHSLPQRHCGNRPTV